ncbi:MAG: hemolysin family protein [Anaerolineales bacterium]|nr:hemolysin family protein [Anaerolineales bacterium]
MLDYTLGIGIIAGLLLINGWLSAARAALMNASRGRLRQMVQEGVGGAARALRVAEDATALLSTMRFSQTFCRFGIAGLSVLLFTRRLSETFGDGLALDPSAQFLIFFLVLLVGTMIVVSIGEFLPEALALRTPENAALFFAPSVAFLEWLLAPVVRLALWLASRAAPSVGGQRAPLVTEEEIKTLVDAGEEGGAIEEDEKEMIYSIFEISDTWARELMVPRIDMLAFDVNTPLPEAIDALLAAGHSRAPVYENSIDNILGILHAKDLLKQLRSGNLDVSLRALLRPAYFVPETKKANELLAELQQKRIHMAIVVDEYGGTAGLVTLEDIVEEIVGDIRDEYDVNEESYVERISDTEYIFDARLDLDEVNDLLKLNLSSEDADSLGGFIYGQLGHIPAPGEKVLAQGVTFEVLMVTGRRIRKVRATLPPLPQTESPELPEPRKINGTRPLTYPPLPVESPTNE